MGDERAQYAIGNGLSTLLIILAPFAIVSLVLWLRRNKRLPSLAFIVTSATGVFFLLFSGAEAIGGFFQKPFDPSAAFGGLIEIATFALPFLIISWLLWVKPKIGAALLILVGIGMGIWIAFGWNLDSFSDDFVIPTLLVGLPVVLGGFTLIKELVHGNGNMNHNATA